MTVTSLPPDAKRLTNLDGLRGLAALAVLLYHYTSIFPRFWPEAEPTGFLVDFGGFGVHLFFIISGFVILMTLEKRGASRDFIIYRFIRLYPRYSTHYVNTAFNKGFGGIRYDKMDFIRTVI